MRNHSIRRPKLGVADALEVDSGRLRWVGTCDVLQWREAVANNNFNAAITLARGSLLFGLVIDPSELAAWLELEQQSFLSLHQQCILRFVAILVEQQDFEKALTALEHVAFLLPLEQDIVLEALQVAKLANLPSRGASIFELHKRELAVLGESPSSEIQAELLTLETVQSVRTERRLPRLLNPLFGRESELEQIQAWVMSDAPLLSLVGVGGIGKTSLAIKGLAQSMAVFVPLAGFSGQSLVSSVATALGAVLSGQSEAATELLAWLQRKPAQILLLDNVEQCLDATRDFLNLIALTNWRVLLTSRLKLAVRSEQILELQGLALPRDESDFNVASVQLFSAAARRVQANWSVRVAESKALVQLCGLLAGTPLALELAASWVRVLSLLEITKEVTRNLDFLEGGLQDLPVQQNGLRAVFTHSFALLPPSQQVALSRLAIFRGGFSREAAVEVTQISFRDLLGLADASLLRFDGGRWFIHELIRQYASEILQTDSLEWNLVAGRYAAFYVELVFRTAPHLLLEEADNFRAVLTWSLSGDEAKQALQLATGLRGFWFGRGFIQEAITWLEAGLGLYDQTDELAIQARLVLAECLQTQGLSETSLRHLEVAISAARELLRTDLASLCHTMFARIYHRQSQYELAIRHCQWALELARPDSPSQAAALRWLGRAGIYIGDPKDALKLYRRFNDHEAVAHCLNSLALIAIERQDFMTARACFKEALGLHRQYQEKHGQALNLTGMGWLEMLSGDLSSARELTLQSLEIHLELGQQWDVLNAELNLGHIAYRTKNLVLAKDYYSKVLAQAGQIEAVSLQLEAMVGMAYVWESMPVLAAQLLGMALGHGQCNNEIISFAKDLNTQLKAVLAADFESVCQQGLERGLEATLIWMFSVFNSEKTIELSGGFHSRTLASKQ